MSVIDWVILGLGITAVIIYLVFSIIKYKKEKNNPKQEQKGDIIDDEE